MFHSNNTIAHTDLELGAVVHDVNHRQGDNIELMHQQKVSVNRSKHISLLTFAMLSSAGIFAMQLVSPAFAGETNADAATKVQKQRELANPGTYVLKQKQKKTDVNPADDPIIIEKKKRDYEKLTSSVKALTTALKRESEKAGVNNAEIFGKVESSLKEANQLAKSGAYDDAHQALEVGYHLLTTTVVTLENLKDQGEGAKTNKALAAKPETVATDPREFVIHEIKTNKALLAALKHQNEDKVGGKEDEIEAIKHTAAEASASLEAGDIALANELIKDANLRTKKAIASLQKTPSKLGGNETYEAGHHPAEEAAKEENIRNSYAKRKANVIALLDAGKRLDSENHTSHPNFATAESMLKEAETLAAVGKFAEGKEQLDRTYVLIKDTMRNMLSLKEEPKAAKSSSPKPKKPKAKTRTDAQQ